VRNMEVRAATMSESRVQHDENVQVGALATDWRAHSIVTPDQRVQFGVKFAGSFFMEQVDPTDVRNMLCRSV
jgi:hypothetical protein